MPPLAPAALWTVLHRPTAVLPPILETHYIVRCLVRPCDTLPNSDRFGQVNTVVALIVMLLGHIEPGGQLLQQEALDVHAAGDSHRLDVWVVRAGRQIRMRILPSCRRRTR